MKKIIPSIIERDYVKSKNGKKINFTKFKNEKNMLEKLRIYFDFLKEKEHKEN